MRKFIELTDVSDGFKEKQIKKVLVAPDGIDVMVPRRRYTTLWVNGSYLHVAETIEQIRRKSGALNLLD